MNKKEIINQINEHYGKFIEYMIKLSQDDFEFRYQEKWSAGQQLEHIVMCVKPLVQVYGMPKSIIEQNFGKVNRPNKTYQELLDEYKGKLKEGGKAPTQYVPEKESSTQRDSLIETLQDLIEKLNSKVDVFEEEELESLVIPHPLLGIITLKEMLYNAIYHVQHHNLQAVNNLNE